MKTKTDKNLYNKKISGSSMRVLELLKAFTNGAVNSHEFFKSVDNDDILFKKEVLWKYINTLKMFDLEINREKDCYYLNNVLEATDYTEKDLSLMRFIEEYIRQINLTSLKDDTNKVLQKVERTFSEDTKKLINSKKILPYPISLSPFVQDKNVQKFEKYCKDGLKLNIKYKIHSDKEMDFKISPLKIIYRQQKAILIAYDCQSCDYKEFLLNYITFDEQTPQKISGNYTSTAIFKLKGRLAKSYVLKDSEKLIEFGEDYADITNSKEDKSMLLKRLLRYYDKCEITYPTDTRKDMIKLIEDIEKIYD